MAKTMKGPAAPAKKGGKPADPRHEKIFEMYRDLGPGRSFRKLLEAIQVRWPANPLSLGTLSNWSLKSDWKRRIEQYDAGLKAVVASAPSPLTTEDSGDDVDNLKRAASKALAGALQSANVAVTKPADLKALIDMASKALELADKLEGERSGTSTPQEIIDFGAKLLGRIEEARRKDIIVLVKTAAEAACVEAGKTNLLPVLKKAAAAVGMRVNDVGEIEPEQGCLLPQVERANGAFTA